MKNLKDNGHVLVNTTRYRIESDILSPRESELFGWLAEGKSYIEISILLGISTPTVRWHMENIRRKLGAGSNCEAVMLACVSGIIKPLVHKKH